MRTLTPEEYEAAKESITEDGPFDTEDEADRRKDWLECTHEIGGFEIVIYEGKYYVL